MSGLRITLALVALLWLSIGARGDDNFLAVTPQGSGYAFTEISYRYPVQFLFKNSDLVSSETFTYTFSPVTLTPFVVYDSDFSYSGLSIPSSGLVEVPANSEELVELGEIAVRVHATSAEEGLFTTFRGDWDVTVSGNFGTLATFRIRIRGSQTNEYSDTLIHYAPSPISATIDNSAISSQVWYQFLAANESGESRSLVIIAVIDGNSVNYKTLAVPSSEGPHNYEGGIMINAESFSLAFPGGSLIEGVSSFTIGDAEVWEAGVLFSGAVPELLRARIVAEVFSEVDQSLIVRDANGEIIGMVDVQAGVYSAQIDVEFEGLPGSSISVEATGDGYVASIEGSSVIEAGEISPVLVQVYESEDPPSLIGSSTTTTVQNGQTVSNPVRTVGNSLGSFTGVQNPGTAWNPQPGFTSGFSVSGTGTGPDTLARIDAELGAYSAGTEALTPGDNEGAADGLEAVAESAAGAISSLPSPEALGAVGKDDVWVVNIPTIGGYEIPEIEIPIDHPAVSWIRFLLLVASSLFWLFRAYETIKS